MIDLHTHSLFSDGVLVPSELVRRAVMKGYEVIAITDHADASNLDFTIPRVAAAGYDAICSFGCGAGVQHVAARLPQTPVYPGLNTQFIGVLESDGVWAERCAGCGSCRLAEFSGVCPIARCSKRLLNGPCGGSQTGRCEISPDVACAWQLIYERARAVGALDRLQGVAEVQEWGTALDGGPRRVVRAEQTIAALTSSRMSAECRTRPGTSFR